MTSYFDWATVTASTIAQELDNAIQYLTFAVPECYYFSVSLMERDAIQQVLQFSVTFETDSPGNKTLLQVFDSSLNGGANLTTSVIRTQAHTPVPTGTFDLHINGIDVDSIPISVTAAGLSLMINAFSDALNVAVTSSAGLGQCSYTGCQFLITFHAPRSDVSLMVDAANAFGQNLQLTAVSKVQGDTGALFFDPIPLWLTEIPLRWATDNITGSVVEIFHMVSSEGGDMLKAVCDGSGDGVPGLLGFAKGNETSCSFNYLVGSSPSLVSASMTAIMVNNTPTYFVTLTGSGFLKAGSPGSINVSVHQQTCNVTSANDTVIVCTLQAVAWGSYIPEVRISGIGLAVPFCYTPLNFTQGVTGLSPTSGGLAGGQMLTLNGFGFHDAPTILINNSICTLISTSSYILMCSTPAVLNYTGGSSLFATISVDGFETALAYNFLVSLTPSIHTVVPSLLSTALNTVVNISGSGLMGLDNITGVSVVFIGSAPCNVLNSSDSFVTCLLTRSSVPQPSQNLSVMVTVEGKGYASVDTSLNTLPSVSQGYEVFTIDPPVGSLLGGTLLTISGAGFSAGTLVTFADSVGSSPYALLLLALDISYSAVTSHVQTCSVISVSFTTIVCRLSQLQSALQETDSMLAASVSTNSILPYVAHVSLLDFVQSSNFTPVVTSISSTATNSTGQTQMIILGSQLLSPSSPTYVVISNDSSSCSVDASLSTDTSLSVICSSLMAGEYANISVLVSSLGYARVVPGVIVNVSLEVVSSTIVAPYGFGGSAMGGAFYSLTGTGFSSNCSSNLVSFMLSNGTIIDGSPFLSYCSNLLISGSMPPIINSNLLLTDFIVNVSSVSVTVGSTSSIFSNFTYEYTGALTPRVRSWALNQTSSSTALTFFTFVPYSDTAYFSSPSITIAGSIPLLCDLTNSTDMVVLNISFVCNVPTIPEGTYSVFIEIPPYGFAAGALDALLLPSFTEGLILNHLSPGPVALSSAAGGLLVNVTGSGLSSSLQVMMANMTIPFTLQDSSSLSFITPAMQTTTYVEYLSAQNINLDLIETIGILNSTTATIFSSIEDAFSETFLAFDNNYKTAFYDNSVGCFIGVSMVGAYRVQPYRMRFYPLFQSSVSISSYTFEGSTDGGLSYTVLASGSTAHESWNFIDSIATSGWYTHLRYHSLDSTSHCQIAEVKFLGVVATLDSVFPVIVLDSLSGIVYPLGSISYNDTNATPVLTSIFPLNGTSLGGSSVTLIGQFGSYSSAPSVLLNGISCEVMAFTNTSIDCITGYRGPENIQTGSVSINIPGLGFTVNSYGIIFVYMDRWSDVRSWKNQQLPVDGDFVWIPDGQSIVLDQDTPNMLFLLVQGALYLDPNVPSIKIDAKYIFVYGGLLQVIVQYIIQLIVNKKY